MAQSKKVSFLRGKRIRATLVDTGGRPVYGDSSVAVSKGVVTLSYTTNTEDGQSITVANMNGDTCVSQSAPSVFTGFGVEAEFCEVDFSLLSMITGQKVYVGDNGQIIGMTESTDVDLSTVNFGLEMWLGSSNAGEYGYVLTPFLGGGVLSDVSVQNDAISFTVTGLTTKNGTGWGTGPYKVENVSGTPSALRTPMLANDHRRTFSTSIAPPVAYAGTQPLLDPAKPAITDFTATVATKQVTFAPTPAGTDPMFYDFGDGTWDYAPTGGYVKTYATAGTWTVTAKRGSSSITKTVTTT